MCARLRLGFATACCLVCLGPAELVCAQETVTIDLVDPMIGTVTVRSPDDFYGLGKTYPGAASPLGMVQLSPDTITGGDNASGYNYLADSIEGFSLCHMSGTGWYGEMGNFQVMPTTGPLQIDRDQARSPFRHDHEMASVGYYSVLLDRYEVRAELTAAPHAGLLRFTFPAKDTSRIQVDLARRIGMKRRWLEHSRQRVEFLDNQTIQGWMDCPHTDGGWGQGAGGVSYRLYFYAKVDKPFDKKGVWDQHEHLSDRQQYEGTNTGFYGEFATTEGEQVLMKVGISYVDIEGAKTNLSAEIADWDFRRVHEATRRRWKETFDRVQLKGGSEQDRVVAATALYHCFLDPRSIVDVDG
ncbi:MAG: glycoside hydrolase domain-containing protein, partial [Bythopirellula sp.]